MESIERTGFLNSMGRLQKAAAQFGPLCVGLDTDVSHIPPKVVEQFDSPADAVLTYNRELVKRITERKAAACFKIQVAYYEALGVRGMRAFADTLRLVREAGSVAISDVKRGDIADTAKAYARAHFSGDFESDIITVNPYMGFDTLSPFADFCSGWDGREGKSIFVLLRTSNKGAGDIEQQALASGKKAHDLVGEELLRLSAGFAAQNAVSPYGAVVGCTNESDAQELREKYRDLFFLIPGYGAQGGAARIAATLLQNAGGVVNSSRAILCAWQKDERLEANRERGMVSISDMAEAAVHAALEAKKDLLAACAEISGSACPSEI